MPPRERMLEDGPASLSDVELVAVLVGSGTRAHPAGDIAARLLGEGLVAFRRAQLGELLATPGVGPAQACRLEAALGMGSRAAVAIAPVPARLLRAHDVARLLWPRLAHLRHEEFWAVLLNARLEALRTVRIAAGGLTHCSVLPREAFAPALVHAAPAIAFVHNHPSGDPSPSGDDQRLELLLDEAGRALGVRVVDHLVVAERGFHSAREGRGALPLDGPIPFAPANALG